MWSGAKGINTNHRWGAQITKGIESQTWKRHGGGIRDTKPEEKQNKFWSKRLSEYKFVGGFAFRLGLPTPPARIKKGLRQSGWVIRHPWPGRRRSNGSPRVETRVGNGAGKTPNIPNHLGRARWARPEGGLDQLPWGGGGTKTGLPCRSEGPNFSK